MSPELCFFLSTVQGQRKPNAESSLFAEVQPVLAFHVAKLKPFFGAYNSCYAHSEQVRKCGMSIRKELRKNAYFRPLIRLKKRFTMLFLRVISCSSQVSLKVQLKISPLGVSIIFEIDDSQGRSSSPRSSRR